MRAREMSMEARRLISCANYGQGGRRVPHLVIETQIQEFNPAYIFGEHTQCCTLSLANSLADAKIAAMVL
jgi:hypothetical protein